MSDLSPLPGGFLKFVCWLCLLLLGDFFKFVCEFARSGAILQRVEKKSWGILHNLVASSFTAADIIIFLSLPADVD